MGDTYVWTGADTSSASGSSPQNIDDPLNWFDTSSNSVATHAPESTDTAIFTASASDLYAGGTADGSGGILVTADEFSPATLEVANGAQITLASGVSPAEYLIGTLEIGSDGSLALVGSTMQANAVDIAAGGTLDLSQAFWIGAPNDGPPGSALQNADRVAQSLGYSSALNAVVDNLAVAAGGQVVLGNGELGVVNLADGNASGTGNAYAPLASIGGSGGGSVVAPSEQGPYGEVGSPTIDFGTVTAGQTVTETLTIYGSANDLGYGVPVGAIQTNVNGANISDPDLSGPGVTAQNFGTADYQPGGAVDFATFAVTLDAQQVGEIAGQAINIAFDLNDGVYGQNVLVPITGDVVAAADNPCFVAGTLVAGAAGDVAVEDLRPGDRVRTAGGRLAPVVWVGHRTQRDEAPVRISAGAFAAGVPRRDLLLSPDHAVLAGGALVPAHLLVNGATITEAARRTVAYVHVELDRHDILLAEGLNAESFLDTGNRGQFDRESGVRPLFQPPVADRLQASLAAYAARGCAPLCLDGPALRRARRAVQRRARALGWRLSEDGAVTIEANGRTVAVTRAAGQLECVLPAGTSSVRIASRWFRPDHLDRQRADGRQLGIAAAIFVDGAPPDDAAFASGWYPPEAGCAWRWTDGDARLALAASGRAVALTVRVMQAGARYWLPPDTRRRAA